MNIDLSEKIISGLNNIQSNSESINDAITNLENLIFLYDEGSVIDADEALVKFNALRNIRYLKDLLSSVST